MRLIQEVTISNLDEQQDVEALKRMAQFSPK